MAVVVMVAVLAGLVLSTIGYVNRKGAASRAKTEVAALSSAIESYKLDFGSCPARPALLGQQFSDRGRSQYRSRRRGFEW